MKKIVINFFIAFLVLALSPACQALSTNFIKRGGKHCTGYCEIENIICEKSKDKQGYYDWCQKNCTHEKKKNRDSFVDAITYCNSLIKCQASCTKDKIICIGKNETYSQCQKEYDLKFKNITKTKSDKIITEIKSGLEKCENQVKMLDKCQADCTSDKLKCTGDINLKSYQWCADNCQSLFPKDSLFVTNIKNCDSQIVEANRKQINIKKEQQKQEHERDKEKQNAAELMKKEDATKNEMKEKQDRYNRLSPDQREKLEKDFQTALAKAKQCRDTQGYYSQDCERYILDFRRYIHTETLNHNSISESIGLGKRT